MISSFIGRFTWYLALFAFGWGCNPMIMEEPDYEDRLVIKKESFSKGKTIELYHYSLLTGYSPKFIELNDGKEHFTICESSYVTDISLKNDTLLISLSRKDDLKLHHDEIKDLVVLVNIQGQQPVY